MRQSHAEHEISEALVGAQAIEFRIKLKVRHVPRTIFIGSFERCERPILIAIDDSSAMSDDSLPLCLSRFLQESFQLGDCV